MLVGRIGQGEQVLVLDGPVTLNDEVWYRVKSQLTHIEGWVNGEFLTLERQ
jgi:hypothetical protein